MELKVGDIVILKTGGPEMTVNRVGPIDLDYYKLANGMVEAIWFANEEAAAFTDHFGIAALMKVADPAKEEAAA